MISTFMLSYKGERFPVIVDNQKIKEEILTRGACLNRMVNGKLYVRMRDSSYATHTVILNIPRNKGRVRFKNKNTLDLRKKNLKIY